MTLLEENIIKGLMDRPSRSLNNIAFELDMSTPDIEPTLVELARQGRIHKVEGIDRWALGPAEEAAGEIPND
jgi:hypothetical protein